MKFPRDATFHDYNGEGRWSRAEVLTRYAQHAAELGGATRDVSPREDVTRGVRRVYPVMHEVTKGILAGDAACVRLGIEFIEEDAFFPFGRILKANAARALRRTTLSPQQEARIRRRVFGMLRDGHTWREFQQHARLVRHIGFDASKIPAVDPANHYAVRWRAYFEAAVGSAR